MKTLLTTTALGLSLAITPALAAPATSTDSSSGSPAATQTPDTVQTSPAMPSAVDKPSDPRGTLMEESTPAGKSASDMKSDTQQSAFMTSQSPDDQLVSKLIGQSVYNSANEEIGEIEDLVTTRDGKIVAAIIETGDFLGLGGKHVAVSFDTLQFTRGEDNEVRVSMNVAQERLNSAPEFKTLDDQMSAAPATTKAK